MTPSVNKQSAIKTKVFGRATEISRIRACLQARKNVLLEGPVGVGKTHLALAVCQELGRPIFRIDGDSRYSEQKLTGWFDPPTVLEKGYVNEAFFSGPLVEAMRKGGVLFINELNRLPEGVQNVLLPAIDERMILIPRLGEVHASEGFVVIATQNPKEFVATSHLSEAILDRFELVFLDYQSEAEELQIVQSRVPNEAIARLAVALARATRSHPKIRRGASVRAAQSVAEIAMQFLAEGASIQDAVFQAALVAFPTRIEIEKDGEGSQMAEFEKILKDLLSESQKKKN